MDIREQNAYIFNGLYINLARTREFTQHTYYKVLTAQRHYYFNSTGIDFTKEQEETITLLDEALHKFYWGTLSLEQMWAVHHHMENPYTPLPDFYDVQITTEQNELIFLFAYLLDQTLYTWRSFLDYYLNYLLNFLTGNVVPSISTKTFRRQMERHLNETEDDRTEKVFTYIKTKVLCTTYGGENQQWGDFLRSLRDKTTHQKLIKPTLDKKENARGYDITWPKIQGRDYAELAQWEFGNKAFEMLRELFPVLYGFAWIPGPYKPGMYRK